MFSRKVLESVYRANIARGKVPYAVFPVMAIGGAAAAADNKLTPQQEKVLHEGSAPNKAQYSATAKTDYENHSQGRTDKFRVTPTITGTSNTTSYNQYNPTIPGSSDSTSMTKSNPSSTLTGSQGYTGNQGYTGSYSSLRPENQFSTALAGENLEDRGPDSSLLKRVTQGQTGWSYPKIFDKDFWNRPLDESGRVLGTYVRQVSLDLQRHPLRPEHQFSTALAGENLEDRGPEDSLLKRVTHKVGEYLPHDINMKRDYTEKIYRDYDTDYTKRDYNVRNVAYDKTTQMMDKSKEKIGEMKDKTADTAYNLKEKGKEVASDMMDKSKEKMGEMKEKTADTAYNLKEKGKEVASDVMDKSKEKVGEMKEKTADTAHNLKEKGMEVASEIKEKAYEAKEKMSEKIHEYAPSTQDMKEKFYETKEKAEQVGHNLKDKVAEYIPTSLSPITDTVKSAVVGSENNESKVPGDSERFKTRMGEEAANLLQSHTPINSFKTHTSTIRVFADEPKRQLMTHKYTAHVNEDVMQTLIMDSDKADARLIGIEYCITDKLYKSLPAEEKKLWYSHAFEAKSGIEVAPRLPSSMENKLMEDIAPTWGKSISMWQVDKNLLPVGFPKLLAPPANAQMINKDVWEQREKMFGPISKERQMRLPNVGKEDAWEKKGAIFTPDYKKL